eukprot:TRINITY_DN876_c0_g1_i2.p1 TRINITY_DN876_c0_g1~~TRINITY_DN876_c0_g1_i2.p1  ORF type:complete len:730 (-),score=242.03 TRINITY_DN876_c0_g1_i2:776-2965(-)
MATDSGCAQLLLSQKEWTRFIHQALLYLTQTNPPLSSGLYKVDRQILPAGFTESSKNAQFCYPFKGTFLPSGNLDGKVWKPSQGAKPTGTGLLKRYFYYKKDAVRIKRQVIWLIDREDWCFLDYRYMISGAKSKIRLDGVLIPPGLNFGHLVSLATKVIIPNDVYDKRLRLKKGAGRADSDDDDDVLVGDEPLPLDLPAGAPGNYAVDPTTLRVYAMDAAAARGYFPEPAPAPAKFTPDRGYTPLGQAASYTPDRGYAPAGQAASFRVGQPSTASYLSTSPYANQGYPSQSYPYVDPLSFMPTDYSTLSSSRDRAASSNLFGACDPYDLQLGDSPSSGLLDFDDIIGDAPPSFPSPLFNSTSTDHNVMSQYIDDSITGMGPLSSPSGMDLDDDAELFTMDRQVCTLLTERVSSFTDEDVNFYPADPPPPQHLFDLTASGDSVFPDIDDAFGAPNLSKKRKTVELPLVPSFPEVSPLTRAEPAAAPLSMPSFFVAPMDYIIGTIADHMCKQLVFKRTVFLRTGVDCDTLLEKLKMQRVAVDFREFPGRMLSSFFAWLFDSVCRIQPNMLPPMYCMVCGRASTMPHDEHKHAVFYKALDPTLVQMLTARVRNVYDIVHQLLAYLLKHPQRHESFRTLVDKSLHCPFCAGQHGQHNDPQHNLWKDVLRLDSHSSLSKEPPKPAGNLEQYTKVTFEWILDQVPFSIPPFLLRLQCVQSFLECAVVMWRTVRLT